MKTEVTVLMSVYNDKKNLKESIESILNQTYKDFEFLIFDDASTDGSKEILEQYERLDSRIKLVINNTNKGLSYNLAQGVVASRTPWIARMDADDIAVNNRIEIQMNYVKEHPNVDIVGSYTIDINEDGKELGLRKMPITHERISSLIWACPFVHPTVLYKKEAILLAGSYDEKLRRRQDYELWFRCKAAKLRFANIDIPLIYYRCTNEYYKKNNFKVQVYQAKIGWNGAKMVKATPIAYFGIILSFLKGVLPYSIRKPLNEVLKKIDPRRM